MKATERLNKMLGQTFLYLGAAVLIQNYQKKDGKIRVITDKRDYNLAEDELGDFLEELLPMNEEVEPPSNKPAVVSQVSEILNNSPLLQLQDILMDNIKKVQQSKEYIPQATNIQKQVKTMVDVTKVQLQCYKAINKFNKKS